MKVATIIARVLLGLVFVVFGSNIFLHFIPMPPPPPTLVGDFTKALSLSHYLHVVAVFQIVGGLLLLIGRFVPLGLVLLAPVIVNIDLVHLLMEPSGLPMAALVTLLLIFLVWRYRDAFRGILTP
ncbi:MAG TPA: DoxX family membrane protein [Candidatus Udaeobacter sp.]|nr:DoxX family membrane protein [Candidatus Udaeobacter sp.]